MGGTGNKGRITASISDGITRIGTDISSTPQYNDGNWHHVVATFDRGSALSLYVDGGLITTVDISSLSNADLTNSHNLTLGKRVNSLFYTGQLDDVRIYNYALSPAQITKVYNQGYGVRYAPETGN